VVALVIRYRPNRRPLGRSRVRTAPTPRAAGEDHPAAGAGQGGGWVARVPGLQLADATADVIDEEQPHLVVEGGAPEDKGEARPYRLPRLSRHGQHGSRHGLVPRRPRQRRHAQGQRFLEDARQVGQLVVQEDPRLQFLGAGPAGRFGRALGAFLPPGEQHGRTPSFQRSGHVARGPHRVACLEQRPGSRGCRRALGASGASRSVKDRLPGAAPGRLPPHGRVRSVGL
jgi:hypothetical protein